MRALKHNKPTKLQPYNIYYIIYFNEDRRACTKRDGNKKNPSASLPVGHIPSANKIRFWSNPGGISSRIPATWERRWIFLLAQMRKIRTPIVKGMLGAKARLKGARRGCQTRTFPFQITSTNESVLWWIFHQAAPKQFGSWGRREWERRAGDSMRNRAKTNKKRLFMVSHANGGDLAFLFFTARHSALS